VVDARYVNLPTAEFASDAIGARVDGPDVFTTKLAEKLRTRSVRNATATGSR
jgi:hypothetical protein